MLGQKVKGTDVMSKHGSWGWWSNTEVNGGTMPGHIGATQNSVRASVFGLR